MIDNHHKHNVWSEFGGAPVLDNHHRHDVWSEFGGAPVFESRPHKRRPIHPKDVTSSQKTFPNLHTRNPPQEYLGYEQFGSKVGRSVVSWFKKAASKTGRSLFFRLRKCTKAVGPLFLKIKKTHETGRSYSKQMRPVRLNVFDGVNSPSPAPPPTCALHVHVQVLQKESI